MSEAVEAPRNLGILAFIGPGGKERYEASRSEEERRRDFAVKRLASVYHCSLEAARAWLDADDAAAIEQAQRVLNAEPYTDIETKGSYH